MTLGGIRWYLEHLSGEEILDRIRRLGGGGEGLRTHSPHGQFFELRADVAEGRRSTTPEAVFAGWRVGETGDAAIQLWLGTSSVDVATSIESNRQGIVVSFHLDGVTIGEADIVAAITAWVAITDPRSRGYVVDRNLPDSFELWDTVVANPIAIPPNAEFLWLPGRSPTILVSDQAWFRFWSD